MGLFDIRPLIRLFSTMKAGQYMVEVKRHRNQRTNEQNKWLWGCIYPLMLDAMVDAGWEFTNTEQLHEFFKAQMTADEVVNRETGEIIKFPSSTSRMSTTEFSAYCEKLREYAKEFLNVDIPDPDKYWMLRDNEDHSK